MGASAPQGNQNARKHGFYCDAITVEELRRIVKYAEERPSLRQEIDVFRVYLRRLFLYLTEGEESTRQDLVTVGKLIVATGRTIARVEDQQEFVAALVWDAAGLPLVHAPTRYHYDVHQLSESLRRHVREIPLATHGGERQATPLCPQFGTPMGLRMAKHDRSAGNRFWGFVNYPRCPQIAPHDG